MPYTQSWGISRNAFQSPFSYMGTIDQKKEKKDEVKDEGALIPEDNPATNIIKKNNKRSWLDWAQDALTVAGMVPVIGNVADAANVAVSSGRAAYAHITGDKDAAKSHLGNAALSAAAAVPIVGQAAGATKLVKSAKTIKGLDTAGKLALKGTKLAQSGAEEIELAENRRRDNIIKNAPIYAGDDDSNVLNPFIKPKTNPIFI